ncbi:class I SAM-dependent methyltransferase [Streptomyces litchfieldiae]|uniref:Class I SAM-dependent methyltransferase n=1 Tax=Streptomyces litchfieldiae TaxID=3075543 RepID=A0ABU2MRZ8_9ACTN|nr:class I SAM-dependent methyltransferase [Streptomyces sp. DSM 44938]MDT0344406.1 class I SAM-dependent methyltransferase [Streptomyces sp. DSM 44938]
MPTAVDHYDQLLAAHYTWMLGGDIAELAAGQTALLRDLAVSPGPSRLAVDLGCGSGAQSLALAGLGFDPVLAVDTSRPLLAELARHAEATAPAVRPVHADLRGALPAHTEPGSAAAIVCMGDTLTHLPTRQDVVSLLGDAARALAGGGKLVLSYRDLTAPLTGTDRFIPVRATPDRIMTCFLEYWDESTVVVHDLIHVRSGDTWTLRTGSYPKLRVHPDWLAGECRSAGMDVVHNGTVPRGLRVIAAVKP